ncbi:MAG: dynamin family protein, partial [Sneathiellales bacterium]|nr:dynamin family protein [Sneathiellales bacterium]
MFDLKQLRERARITQAQLAQRLKTSQVQISRYEAAPDNVPIGKIQEYLAALGLDLATEVAKSKAEQLVTSINVRQPYKDLYTSLTPTLNYLETVSSTPRLLETILPQPDDLKHVIEQSVKKPHILITGPFDAGKSHMANFLLGKHCLPANYQPETRLPVYLHHMDDRPSFIPEEVWIMGPGFSPELWADEEHAMMHKKISGNYFTLNDWATHSGRSDGSALGAALVFVDSPILEGCVLIDVPGNLHNNEDQKLSSSVLSHADLVIYASPAKGFLNGHDLIQLGAIQQHLQTKYPKSRAAPGESRLAIVATHADPSVKDRNLKDILSRGTARFSEEIDGKSSDKGNLQSTGIFSFWEETPERNKDFLTWLEQQLAHELPDHTRSRISLALREFVQNAGYRCDQQIDLLNEIERGGRAVIESRLAFKGTDPQKRSILDQLRKLQNDTPGNINSLFRSILEPKALGQLIKKRYPKKEQARQYAAAYITNHLQSEVREMLHAETVKLLPQIEVYIEDALNFLSGENRKKQSPPQDVLLNVRGLVLGGTLGVASIGPLAAWASHLGPWGGYLVFVEGASALGMGMASASSLVAAVTAIGGPAVLAAAMIVSSAAIGASILGRKWHD